MKLFADLLTKLNETVEIEEKTLGVQPFMPFHHAFSLLRSLGKKGTR